MTNQQINKSTNQQILLEACVENLAEALKSGQLGAGRIELCENLTVGGTTPSYGSIATCNKYLSIPVIVMIRPRGGNFVYSEKEIETMLEDIRICKELGVAGIATGILTSRGEVNMKILQRFIDAAGPMQFTFHKAIDETVNIENEVMKLSETGIHRILTSGGKATALEGASMLNRLVEIAAGKVIILPAGKISSENIHVISSLIPVSEFHGRKIVGNLN